MSDLALPALKNKQAVATVRILNVVRWLGVGLSVLMLLNGIALLGDDTWAGLGVGLILASVVYGVLSYALIGWFVDSLNLLVQIARNTAR